MCIKLGAQILPLVGSVEPPLEDDSVWVSGKVLPAMTWVLSSELLIALKAANCKNLVGDH